MEKVLVTGAGGYLGCVLVPKLLKAGYAVRALGLYRHRTPGLLHVVDNPDLEIVRGDCREEGLMKYCVKGVDWVIPLAAIVGAPACDNTLANDVIEVNQNAILTLLAHRPANCKIIYPNTNSGYGTTPPGTECTEDTPMNPISLYGRTKLQAEQAVLESGNCIVFRLATAFGPSPRMRTDLLVNDMVWRAVKDRSLVLYQPENRRNYIHVQDIARAFRHGMMFFNDMKNRPYNVGSFHCTKRELCELVQKVVPGFTYTESSFAVDPDKRDYQVSTARIGETGFHCSTDILTGIRQLVQAYQMFPPSEFANA